MKINAAGLELIKSFEGCVLESYKDAVGINTIGFGHVGPESAPGSIISQERAEELLAQDLVKFEKGVSSLLKQPVSSNQFSAMVCFAYNVGLANFKSSLLLRCVNMLHPKDAADQFLRWNKAKGHVLAGLTRRRQAERALFLTE